MELWNEARGIPRYDVSSWGQVFDKQKFRLLKQSPDRAGYLRVKLWIAVERKTVSVHRLVADAFYDCGVDGWEVNHIDGDKTNNHVVNLELTTSPGNVSKTLRGLQPTCKGYTFERIGGEAHDS